MHGGHHCARTVATAITNGRDRRWHFVKRAIRLAFPFVYVQFPFRFPRKPLLPPTLLLSDTSFASTCTDPPIVRKVPIFGFQDSTAEPTDGTSRR